MCIRDRQNAVVKSPDQATYVYGDVVQLTAVPQPGWAFVGWSGAVNSLSLIHI